MHKLLGSLLLVSLLSRPAVLRIDFVAYEVYKAQNHLIAIVKRIQTENDKKTDTELAAEVEFMMADIDNNIHSINKLLKDKNNILGKIQTNMSLKAHSKSVMTEGQIATFQHFYAAYTEKSDKVNDTLSEIEKQLSLKNATGIFKSNHNNETDYENIINEFKSISDSQYDAIFTLNSIIELGEETLAFI